MKKSSINFVDDLEDPADDYYLEDFIKGFEILKLRIDKLRSYSTDLDAVVSSTKILITPCRKTLKKESGCCWRLQNL